MTDKGTMADHIEDLMTELGRVRAELEQVREVSWALAIHIANTTSDKPAEQILREAHQAARGHW